jgi:hypothetical protein
MKSTSSLASCKCNIFLNCTVLNVKANRLVQPAPDKLSNLRSAIRQTVTGFTDIVVLFCFFSLSNKIRIKPVKILRQAVFSFCFHLEMDNHIE